MTLQLLHSEFPYIWGKFVFLFYQCRDQREMREGGSRRWQMFGICLGPWWWMVPLSFNLKPHCKKRLPFFPSPAGMSITKFSLAGSKINYSRPGRVWLVTSRLGTWKTKTFFTVHLVIKLCFLGHFPQRLTPCIFFISVFSVFQIVQFQNDPCNASDGTTIGTCYTAAECTARNGFASGSCASNFGVCCTGNLQFFLAPIFSDKRWISLTCMWLVRGKVNWPDLGHVESLQFCVRVCTKTISPVTRWPRFCRLIHTQNGILIILNSVSDNGLCPEAEFLDEIQTKVIRVFLLAIHRHLYSFALRFLFLQTHATSYSFLQFSYCTL